jgi:arginyl-tRNA synthetase
MTVLVYHKLKQLLYAWRPEAEWSRPKDPSHGLLASSLAFRQSKIDHASPMETAKNLATDLSSYLDKNDLTAYEVVVMGPYLNLRLRRSSYTQLAAIISDQPLTLVSKRTVMLEYVGANVAKRFHAGHMRNLNIGEALRRLLKDKYGVGLITDNHWGDWGVQFGIILWAYGQNLDQDAYNEDPMTELQRLYVWGNAQKEKVDDWDALVRQEFLKLEQGDIVNRKLWQEFVSISKAELATELPLLGVPPTDLELGESYYEGRMKELTTFLDHEQLWKQEGSARYFDLVDLDAAYESFGRCYLISSNGYTTYAFRDVAARLEWSISYNIQTAITITDKTQAHNFDQAFAIITWLAKNEAFRAQYGTEVSLRIVPDALVHVGYGFLSLTSGKMSTRQGNVLRMTQLIDEVTQAADAELARRDADLDVVERYRRAQVIAVASLKWADLNRDPLTDVVLDPERVIAFEGNTGTYQLYTYARLRSLLRRAEVEPIVVPEIPSSHPAIYTPAEETLLSLCYAFPDVCEQAAREYRPNLVTTAIADLTARTSKWYESTHVLKAEASRRALLVVLCTTISETLARGLDLMAIEVLEEL